ncbi:hypothetical protein IG631_11055 [Alternaria alternata]|nr:hypothetical protein IG631_11055 [Alternaria alternata]
MLTSEGDGSDYPKPLSSPQSASGVLTPGHGWGLHPAWSDADCKRIDLRMMSSCGREFGVKNVEMRRWLGG